MTGKTILITGGAGYIGSHAVLELIKEGHKVVVLDNLIYGHKDIISQYKQVQFIEGDILDDEVLKSVFDKLDIYAVMHFAAFAYVGESIHSPARYYTNNLMGTVNLLNKMLEANVKRFIFSSTCATYGIPKSLPITEDEFQNPINPYGRSKLMIEKILKDYDAAYQLKSVIFRYFNAAGADPELRTGEDHTPETHLIPLVLEAAKNNSEINVFGNDYETPDGTCIRDYIHVADIARAHCLGLKYLSNHNLSNQFNLGCGEGASVMQIIKIAEEVTGHKINVKICPKRKGDPPKLIGSAEKAQEVLQWHPEYNINDMMTHAWKWILKIRN